MLGLPDRQYDDVQIFTAPNALTGGVYYWNTYWLKPRGYTMAQIQAISGGGGGGGGKSAASGNNRGGGGGGQSGSIATALYHLDDIPDVLYLLIGRGGTGGAADTDGGAAGPSIIYIEADTNLSVDASSVILRASSSSAQGGLKGTATAAGAGGSGETASSIAQTTLAQMANYHTYIGQAGAAGGLHTGAVGGNATFATSVGVCMGGAGGAGVGSDDVGKAGGFVTRITGTRLSEACAAAAAAGSNDGAGGFAAGPPMYPFWAFPGCGGASNGTGVGGNGGRGSTGSGGGGGGGGTTGGSGGDGGNGRIRITCTGCRP